MERILRAIEPNRARIGRIALVGHGWDALPPWAVPMKIEDFYYTDPSYLERMGVEGARDRAGAERARARGREVEDLLVSQVDPVEGAEGDDARRRVRRGGLESPDDPHGVSARA